uniref:non-specific serine/threonine protein kinase n=1 Tax=Globisporangium ultimum (strain ATCC 200006 / CBS 805.95 / DAOM BR144) TaxID=431595 RepID=K3WY92_GLOUD
MRRHEKDESRKGPLRQSAESSKFPSKDSTFDERTRMVLLKLMNQGKLDVVHGRINTGKEANTYRAVGSNEETARELHYAVKIFKTARADFTKSNECDTSGRQYNTTFIKKTMRRQLKEWTEKEYKNLRRASNAGVQTPTPLLFRDHILIMDFLGQDGVPAPKLKDVVLTNKQLQLAYVDVLRTIRTLYQKAHLVHARLNESNILHHDDKCWLVDFSEAVPCPQPGHEELLEQDLERIYAFFHSRGLQRAVKGKVGLLTTATAKTLVTSEDPVESVLKYYPLLQQALEL